MKNNFEYDFLSNLVGFTFAIYFAIKIIFLVEFQFSFIGFQKQTIGMRISYESFDKNSKIRYFVNVRYYNKYWEKDTVGLVTYYIENPKLIEIPALLNIYYSKDTAILYTDNKDKVTRSKIILNLVGIILLCLGAFVTGNNLLKLIGAKRKRHAGQ